MRPPTRSIIISTHVLIIPQITWVGFSVSQRAVQSKRGALAFKNRMDWIIRSLDHQIIRLQVKVPGGQDDRRTELPLPPFPHSLLPGSSPSDYDIIIRLRRLHTSSLCRQPLFGIALYEDNFNQLVLRDFNQIDSLDRAGLTKLLAFEPNPTPCTYPK